MKNISILGSTGSIGTQALSIIGQFPKEFKIVGLSANNNVELLKEQIKKYKPICVCLNDKEKADALKNQVNAEVVSGTNGVVKIATLPDADTVLTGIVGSAGVIPTINAIQAGKDIALANKETLVCAGNVVMEQAHKTGSMIMPVDSEHSALFQCLVGEKNTDINKLILTCSGGPFREYSIEQLKNVTVQDALNHPTWKMGKKISVDSATLMNKGFEVIEAYWLYGIDYDKIEVVIHPESIVHSMVEFNDKSIKAQLGFSSMKLPILYALSYPRRFKADIPSIDLKKSFSLNFKMPDDGKFPCLKMAYQAGKIGGTMPAALNAANEIAVNYFLNEKISYSNIAEIISKIISSHKSINNPDIDEIMNTDEKVKLETIKLINETNSKTNKQ